MNPTTIIPALPTYLQEAWTKSGFKELTPIQQKMIPVALKDANIVAEAPTGSGKTLAYLLPSLEKIDTSILQAQVVIVASSRELVMQILDNVTNWTAGSGITGAALIGGANVKRQLEKLKKKPQVIVGTPGRLVELVKSKKLKLHEVKTLILDEADQLFAKEHIDEVDTLMKGVMKDCQRIVCSATIPTYVEKQAVERMATAPEIIRIALDKDMLQRVAHVYLVAERREKPKLLRKLVNMEGMYGLAFSNDIHELETFAERLAFRGKTVGVLHGTTGKQEREQAIKQFRQGEVPILMATDVASRGLDIDDLTHVIQLDLANDIQQYVHRSGRTGRAGKTGTVVSLVTEGEKERLLQIGAKLGITLEEKSLSGGQLV
ncbi:DEAD/DEAH box helicase [Salipaludibacillus sp. LMS25]|jgi:superfamily II DNA/RNA helicase|uniref:DEAD/DEAH box helicase n=1 Tax=Salipaludibacillus sp. LMS25 TaxID=2924031 RepID=UPI0020D04E95|nr:DEAD/DEAH box helicase [Salipaludibacillus sp. LMS25]UTR13718.1 DEAD/DEAH box helicase [Salipaludibacillus sp. LMS25]